MDRPITRKELQQFDPKPFLRLKAIDKTSNFISELIYKAASGVAPRGHEQWKMVGKHKLMIQAILIKNNFYISNPYIEGHEYFPDILPDVVKKLQTLFPDVDFRQDEISSYLIVDWS